MAKTWFVTGAGSGIGAGIARAALEAGDKVVATGRDLDKLHDALKGASDENLALVRLDVTDRTQVGAAVEAAMERFGRIDVAVNNAGHCLLGNFEELAWEEIEQQIDTNLYGVMHVMRAVLPVMRKQRSGHIMNIGSGGGVMWFRQSGAYGTSKFALEGLTLCVALEIEQFGIKTTLVEPGFFRTDLLGDKNVRYAESSIADYAHEGSARDQWSVYDGVQPGDPLKLGRALVTVANMAEPPRIFAAGSDALEMIERAASERLKDAQAHAELSRSTDGDFPKVP